MDTEIEIHRFLADFRASPDGQTLLESANNGREGSNLCVSTAGKRWKAMTEAQKAVSFFAPCVYDGSRC